MKPNIVTTNPGILNFKVDENEPSITIIRGNNVLIKVPAFKVNDFVTSLSTFFRYY